MTRAMLLGAVVLIGVLVSISVRGVQHSPVTNIACRNPVPVTLTVTRGVWNARLGTTTYRLARLAPPLREVLQAQGTTSVMLHAPPKTSYQQILKAGDVCRSAGADCVNFEIEREGAPPN